MSVSQNIIVSFINFVHLSLTLCVISRLMMNIDDQEMVNKTGRSGTSVFTERPLYIGGTDFTMSDNLVSSTARFTGCVSDFTVNGA